MDIQERHVGIATVLDLAGRMVLDEDETDTILKDRVAELVGLGRRHIILNLSEITQVDTSGLTALVTAHLMAARRGARISLARPTARIRELLAITRLNALFEVFEAEHHAISAFAEGTKAAV